MCIIVQLAYMKSDNFMFHIKLFLAITNMDKQVRIDLSNLCL